MVLQMGFNQVRFGQDVVVNKENDVAERFADSDISSCGGASLRLGEQAEVGVATGLFAQNLLSVVRRHVVDDHNLVQVPTDGLMLDTVDRIREHVRTVQRRNDYAY